MKQIQFNQLKTSSLGFGCSTLAADLRLRQAKDVLETAFELGITHYDVARSYGYGRCEYILGKFLKGRREKVTVATKFGNVMRDPPLNHHVINILRRAINSFPKLKSEARSAASTRPTPANLFSVSEATKSLHASLKELNTDYIDIFLLHECSLLAANDPRLIEFLDKAVQDGKIRQYGLATAFYNLPANSKEISGKHSIIQSESASLEGYIENEGPTPSRLLIGHSIFSGLGGLYKKLTDNINLQPQDAPDMLLLRDALNSGKEGLAKLMLLNARRRNPNGIVIFSSTNKDNIKANVNAWVSQDSRLAEVSALEKLLSNPKK